MPTPITSLIPMFGREVNAPGIENFDLGGGDSVGYIEDGFWDARLAGMLADYVVADGADVTPTGTTGVKYFTDRATLSKDLGQELWMMIVIFAGFRLLRLKIMNLAINFKAVAGPVSYEQQASATTLRAMLDSLSRRVQELKATYSDQYTGAFYYMDGVLQSEYALLSGLNYESVIL